MSRPTTSRDPGAACPRPRSGPRAECATARAAVWCRRAAGRARRAWRGRRGRRAPAQRAEIECAWRQYGRSPARRHPLRLRPDMTGLIFHLIPHPHWAREWCLPRAAFQARLVAVLADLIEPLQRDPAYRSFLLDGQTVLLEDYVSARPERETDIKALVKTGRLQVGPWYVLPDEQIPSGEGLVRNLLLGAADAERWGGRLDVLYSPDAFGHPAAWPTLAREFGIRYGVVWRGLGGEPRQGRDRYRWRGLDGEEVLLSPLPRA